MIKPFDIEEMSIGRIITLASHLKKTKFSVVKYHQWIALLSFPQLQLESEVYNLY